MLYFVKVVKIDSIFNYVTSKPQY